MEMGLGFHASRHPDEISRCQGFVEPCIIEYSCICFHKFHLDLVASKGCKSTAADVSISDIFYRALLTIVVRVDTLHN